jgi:hypothetical protein
MHVMKHYKMCKNQWNVHLNAQSGQKAMELQRTHKGAWYSFICMYSEWLPDVMQDKVK